MKQLFLCLIAISFTFAEPIDDFLSKMEAEVKVQQPNFKGFSLERGEKIFTTSNVGKKGEAISCISCHGTDFTKKGKHFFTGKFIDPLSRKANPKAFTNEKHVEKWLKRNFKDVYNRVGTPKEKGDVVTYMLSKSR